MCTNNWIKRKRGALSARPASACSHQHLHSLLSRPSWGLDSRMSGTSFCYSIIYGSSAVYVETPYAYMYIDIVIYAYIGIYYVSIFFMHTFCPLCLLNRWKKSDVVTDKSQPIADSHQSGKAALNIFSSVIQHSRYKASATNNSSARLHRTETIFKWER